MARSSTGCQPSDGWRHWQLRRRARGKGKQPMAHGRYTATKRTLLNGVQLRAPRIPPMVESAAWRAR